MHRPLFSSSLRLAGVAILLLALTACVPPKPSSSTATSTSTSTSTSSSTSTATSPAACAFNGLSIKSGASVTAFQADVVPAGQKCVSEKRVCRDGKLSGTFLYAACAAALPPENSIRVMPSGGNDTARLQSIVDSAKTGATISFSPGNYRIDTLNLKSNVTLKGDAGAILRARGTGPILHVDSDVHDVVIDSLTLIGTGVEPDMAAIGLRGYRITVTNSVFEKNGLYFENLRQARVAYNQFRNIGNDTSGGAIGGWGIYDSVITRNKLSYVYQGISMNFGGALQGNNIEISYNTGIGMRRMGIELHDPEGGGATKNIVVKGNYFSDWSNPVQDAIPYSIVVNGGTGTQVLDNYAKSIYPDTWGICIEIAGPGAIVKGNYVDSCGGICAWSPKIIIENNNILNTAAPISCTQSDTIVRNNTSDPSLPAPPAP